MPKNLGELLAWLQIFSVPTSNPSAMPASPDPTYAGGEVAGGMGGRWEAAGSGREEVDGS